jgi:hypothetical protein
MSPSSTDVKRKTDESLFRKAGRQSLPDTIRRGSVGQAPPAVSFWNRL